jgi:ubiquinone/menaquinone biosynthesis C-methylase UbiE
MSDEGRPNPWLSIPAREYEGHMGSPSVGQLRFLSDVFARLLVELEPESLAVLGCATGNGFEHIRPDRTRRVVGIDINSEYLEVSRMRFADRIPGLELICSDIASCELQRESMDLVHAALVLEYVDPATVVEKASRWLRPGGVLSVVLQLPGESRDKVSETPFASLKSLESVMELVDPMRLQELAWKCGLSDSRSNTVSLESGKSFFMGMYRLESPRR